MTSHNSFDNPRQRVNRRTVLAGTGAFAAAAFSAPARAADPSLWTAREAQAALASGDLVLLDIRTPEEWAETGVAEGAWPVSLNDPDFGKNLSKTFDLLDGRTLGFICATGGRSAYVQSILRKNGVTDTIDVTEGMMGSNKGRGWIASGLPVVSADAALQTLPRQLSR